MPVDVTTVADDAVVVHVDSRAHRFEDLRPDTPYDLDVPDAAAVAVRTLPRPPGERLATVATVNDLHLGEPVAGRIGGMPGGPQLSREPGERPYAEVMNEAAADEIDALLPAVDAVLAKGDLTDAARGDEIETFCRCWHDRFDDRLHFVRGNHDATESPLPWTGHRLIDVPGLRVALLDTAVPGREGGALNVSAVEWLETAIADADRPVIAMGHHPIYHPDDPVYDDTFKLDVASTERLVSLVTRSRRLVAYAAGHTHRNVVRHVDGLGSFPFIEVACVKDFPGSWAEYRIHEGGVLQVHHRISAPEALEWSERCRGLYADFGLDYASYALGRLSDRCFTIPLR